MVRPVSNPPNPWAGPAVEWLEEPPPALPRVYEEEARTALTRNESPDVPFTFGVNPYRGCAHACAYCYARATHPYLGFGAGTDFETRLVVKTNVAELLRGELARPSWSGDVVALSGNTDPYQPLEASYRLTRACLEVCLERETPVVIVTKGALVARDAELLAELHRRAGAHVSLSIPFLDEAVGRKIEPGASSPARRLAALRTLAEAGVPTGVAVAPLIAGLNDADVPGILRSAAEAGATTAFSIPLRLSGDVRAVFEERLRAAFPERADRVLRAVRDLRGGRPDAGGFGERMRGAGPRWEAAEQLFRVHCRRLGLAHRESAALPRRPRPTQGELFS